MTASQSLCWLTGFQVPESISHRSGLSSPVIGPCLKSKSKINNSRRFREVSTTRKVVLSETVLANRRPNSNGVRMTVKTGYIQTLLSMGSWTSMVTLLVTHRVVRGLRYVHLTQHITSTSGSHMLHPLSNHPYNIQGGSNIYSTFSSHITSERYGARGYRQIPCVCPHMATVS